MSSFPTSPRSATLLWAEAHAPVWTANALAIGLTAEQAAAYESAVTAYQDAALAQENARMAYRSTTENAAAAFNALRSATGDNVRTIRTFAENQPKPMTVYTLAQIPPPASRSPVPPPAQPTGLRVELDASTGALTLLWKASNPPGGSGTSYVVRRKSAADSAFVFLGVTGAKKFVDSTLPAGADSVQYTIQGQRGDLAGPVSEIFTVNFGRAPGGVGLRAFVTSTSNSPSKMAA